MNVVKGDMKQGHISAKCDSYKITASGESLIILLLKHNNYYMLVIINYHKYV